MDQPYNYKIDVYSLGMTTWELVTERTPFGQVRETRNERRA
jgi:serine/threonine protein kinase